MTDRISIIIITYNRAADLLELLINLSKQKNLDTVLEEILILNNASTTNYDEVTEYINNTLSLKIKYTFNNENIGVARGRNKLLKIAKGTIFLSIDDDMAFTEPTDLLQFSTIFQKDIFKTNTGIITFRVIYYENKEVQITAFPHKKYEKYSAKPQFLTYYFAGGAHIMRKEVIQDAGFYPEDFHYGMEEYDLAYRVLEAGYTIGYDNSVTVLHKESPKGRQANYKKLQMQWVNKSKVAWRYLPLIYFFTTAFSWGLQYLKNSKGHIGTFFVSIGQIIKIPFTEKRNVVNKNTLNYLLKVEARLNY